MVEEVVVTELHRITTRQTTVDQGSQGLLCVRRSLQGLQVSKRVPLSRIGFPRVFFIVCIRSLVHRPIGPD